MVVLDYLTHLADRGLAYRTIMLHRSVLSPLFPQWTDTRLVITLSYHVSFEVYFRIILLHNASLHPGMWRRYLPFSPHLHCPSILSLSSANWPFCSPWRLHGAPLRCLRYAAARHSWLSTPALYFIPSRLSKTDRPGHMGSPILIRRRRFSLPHCLSRRVFGISALSRDTAQFPLFFSFAIVYNSVSGVTSLGLPVRQYRSSSWLHAPHLGLGCPRSWR